MVFHRRAELGLYFQHEFCVEMSAGHALVDANRQPVAAPGAETLATFVHEYLHYLQNISTVSGFAGYHASQQLLALFSATVDRTGWSSGSSALSATEKERLSQIDAYLAMLEGDCGPEGWKLKAIQQVDSTRRTLPLGAGVAKLSDVVVRCTVAPTKGAPRLSELRLGLCMIEEGLAFEVDRLVAAMDGADAPINAPFFPYLVLRKLGEHLAPGIRIGKLIACATVALLTNDPAGCLIDALRDFGARTERGESQEDALTAVQLATSAIRVESIHKIIEDLGGLRRMHENRGASAAGMAHITDIFAALLRRRLVDPLWDVRPFLAAPIDPSLLTDLMASVEPCLVLQRLPDNANDPEDEDRPEHDVMLAFGALDKREFAKRSVPVVQCQVHYVNAHLVDAEFVSSDDVDPEDATCPFYRTCTLQLRKDHATLCKEAPWELYQESQEVWCWYGAAVAATVGTVKAE